MALFLDLVSNHFFLQRTKITRFCESSEGSQICVDQFVCMVSALVIWTCSVRLQRSSLELSNLWGRLWHRHAFHALLAVCWRCVEPPDQGSATVWPVEQHLVWSQGLRKSRRFRKRPSNASTPCRGLKHRLWRVLELVENVPSCLRIRSLLLVLALFRQRNLLKFLSKSGCAGTSYALCALRVSYPILVASV